jgi:hypothetical protein
MQTQMFDTFCPFYLACSHLFYIKNYFLLLIANYFYFYIYVKNITHLYKIWEDKNYKEIISISSKHYEIKKIFWKINHHFKNNN